MRTAAHTPSAVIASATSRNGMCDVTRDVHSAPVMLNSLTKPVDAELFLQVTKLVLLREAAQAHRVLVERREHDAVDLAALRGVRGRFERGQRGAAAGLASLRPA